VQATEDEIANSLAGNWRPDVLFELKQVLATYDFLQQQIADCDVQLEKEMQAQPTRSCQAEAEAAAIALAPAPRAEQAKKKGRARPKKAKNQPAFDLQEELKRVLGVDLTRIDGIHVMTAQTVYAELGADLGAAFPNEDHFASWLMLAPKRDVSGGRVIRHYSLHSRNRVAQALRMAAESLHNSRSYLGARYRALRGRLRCGVKAVKAMARYLACVIYRMLTKGEAWVDRGAAYFEQKRQERELCHLQHRAAAIGMQLVAANRLQRPNPKPSYARLKQVTGEFSINRVDGCLHALRDFLHIHVGRCARTGMPEKSLNVLHRSLLLRQRSYRAPDHLEGQLRQLEVPRQFVQHPPAVVAGVHESALGIRKNEGFRRGPPKSTLDIDG
jgi:hypothetical protein